MQSSRHSRVLLMLAAGDSGYRRYMLEAIAARYDILLLSPDPLGWEEPFVHGYWRIDARDNRSTRALAADLARRHPVDGVLTYHEPCVELAAVIGQELGLPHCNPRAAALARDKFAARSAQRAAGLPTVRFSLVRDRDEARFVARTIGYPVVVKPRALSAGFGVSLVVDDGEIGGAFDAAAASTLPEPWAYRPGVLVEEYLDGPEISVDSVVQGGRVQPVVHARKLLGFEPAFEEVGHLVAGRDQVLPDRALAEEVEATVAATHRALGMDNTVTHTELRLTADGPRVVELNGRSGGGLIPYLGTLATGVDLAVAAADVAVGDVPELAAGRSSAAGVGFLYATPAGQARLHELTDADRPGWLHDVVRFPAADSRTPIELSRLYFARIGCAIVTAGSLTECAERLHAATLVALPPQNIGVSPGERLRPSSPED